MSTGLRAPGSAHRKRGVAGLLRSRPVWAAPLPLLDLFRDEGLGVWCITEWCSEVPDCPCGDVQATPVEHSPRLRKALFFHEEPGFFPIDVVAE